MIYGGARLSKYDSQYVYRRVIEETMQILGISSYIDNYVVMKICIYFFLLNKT